MSTPEDFGVQGERPSHPELLDWLASEFVRTGWDVKHLHRLIVSSATYGQSSAVPVEQRDRLERDPANRLLARGPRRRLSSPMIRDNALAVSGLLVPEVGGEPVRPYQPEGVWAAATFGKKKYVRDTGSKLYRRSIYTFWRRIVGPTMFFDVARRQTCEVRTTQTNTPLHALLTMNDITFVEAARHLAQRVMRAESEPEQQIARAFRLVTSRHPRSDEMQLLRSRLERLREQYSAAPQAAEELLRTGDSPRDASPATDKHAAMTALCLLLLNLDEALNR